MTDGRFTNAWQTKTDDEVVEASEALSDYTEEGEQLIRAELRRRGLPEPGPPIGACPRCHRSIHANHPGDTCAQCAEDLPLEMTWMLREMRSGVDRDEAAPAAPATNPITCTRCGVGLEYQGTKKFHEGTRIGVLGEVAELFQHREHFDVYVCPRCGRVEFFVDGIGEEFRSQ